MAYRPRNRVIEIADPSGDVVSLSDLKIRARIDGDDDDADLMALAKEAVTFVEGKTLRLLFRRQVVLRLPGLPGLRDPVELPGGIVSAVSSVVADGDAITGAAAFGDSPAVLVPGADWPAVTGEGYPVVITYTAGYETVPADLALAVKLLVAHWYKYREAVTDGAPSEVPLGLESILSRYRIRPV